MANAVASSPINRGRKIDRNSRAKCRKELSLSTWPSGFRKTQGGIGEELFARVTKLAWEPVLQGQKTPASDNGDADDGPL